MAPPQLFINTKTLELEKQPKDNKGDGDEDFEPENQHEEEITRLQTVIQLSKDEKSELTQIEMNQKLEIEKMEDVIKSLKEANYLMKEHANDSVSVSEQYQENLVELQGSLKVILP